jgi:hypothetical protein
VGRPRDAPARGSFDPARGAERRRPLGEPPRPLLDRARRVDRDRDPRLRHGRGRVAARRRPPVPRLARLPRGGGLPGSARAGHAQGAARRPQRRLRPGHARRPAGGRDPGRAQRGALGDRHAQPPAAARRAVRAHGPVGRCLPGGDRAAQRSDAARVRLDAAHGAGHRRARALRLCRAALRPAVSPAPLGHRRGDHHRLRAARRGDGGGGLRAQLARELVGVARPHAHRLRAPSASATSTSRRPRPARARSA